MAMNNFHLYGYTITKPYTKLSKTDIFFALIKVAVTTVFVPIIMFF